MDLIFSIGSNEYTADRDPVAQVYRGAGALAERLPSVTVISEEYLPATAAHTTNGAVLPVPAYSNAFILVAVPAIFSQEGINRIAKDLELLSGRDRNSPRVALDIDLVAVGSVVLRFRELPRPYCRIPLIKMILSGFFVSSQLHTSLFHSLFL